MVCRLRAKSADGVAMSAVAPIRYIGYYDPLSRGKFLLEVRFGWLEVGQMFVDFDAIAARRRGPSGDTY